MVGQDKAVITRKRTVTTARCVGGPIQATMWVSFMLRRHLCCDSNALRHGSRCTVPVSLATQTTRGKRWSTANTWYLKVDLPQNEGQYPTRRLPGRRGSDYGFITLLWFVSTTGLLLYWLGDTKLSSSMLILHLAGIACLFISIPLVKWYTVSSAWPR